MTIDKKKIRKTEKKNPGYIKSLMDSLDEDRVIQEFEFKPAYKYVEKPQTVRGTKKIGRNEPCPCGSGKKYKKCCGK